MWSPAFVADDVGALSAVWGASPNRVYVVGGRGEQAEVFRFDGQRWHAEAIPDVPNLVWIYGFEDGRLIAVGVGGGVIIHDGVTWSALDSGTSADLWGVWGRSPNDVWIVGGTIGSGEPVLLHYDGSGFTSWPIPENDRQSGALFKVWGIGSSLFAVGQRGLIIEFDGDAWFQVPAGSAADDDFVALWGTAEDRIVAVGGRGSGRVSTWDGLQWSTTQLSGIPGLNAVTMVDADTAIVGGFNGYTATFDFDSRTLTPEMTPTRLAVHGAWSDGAGSVYSVGGRFSAPYEGVALVRTIDLPAPIAQPPVPIPADQVEPECSQDENCSVGHGCADGSCQPMAGCSGSDSDGDGWLDECDNCVDASNPTQKDKDDDGVGDSCDRCRGGDDRQDTDGDGVPDACDRCPGSNDGDDADADTVPDGCDLCANEDDRLDQDSDGVPDGCDLCSDASDQHDGDSDGVPDACDTCSGDDSVDSDLDGVPDDCDACAGFDDALDADDDGIPDACDSCQGSSDADGDGVADDCDQCPAGDDGVDTDGDGVADACDACPGEDDSLDGDTDGVADGCDLCPGFNDLADADNDDVPDGCDNCSGDDTADADGDGVPDACDACPGEDDSADEDSDGAPDGCDACPGLDDHQDDNNDGIPDGCCLVESDCPLGENCVTGLCVVADGPDIQIGQLAPFEAIPDGGDLPLFVGKQGLLDGFMAYQVTGFDPGAVFNITRVMVLDTGEDILTEDDFVQAFEEVEPGINQFGHGIIVFPVMHGGDPSKLFGREAIFSVTFEALSDPSITVSLSQHVILVDGDL